jgi:sugar phosphate isomerase/epimerase
MKTALSIWSTHRYLYDKRWTQEDFIDFSGTVGAEGVELLSVFWRAQDTVAGIAEALRRNRLELACFGACNNLAVADERKRADNVRDITASVDKAELLGAEVVRVFSGDKDKDVSFEEAKSWIIGGLKEAAAYAESKGIVLCLENHGYFAGRADQILEMIGAVGSSALRSTFEEQKLGSARSVENVKRLVSELA